MAIRYECEQCGSVLKINEDRAGKPGKCPKCKTAFTVPQLEEFPNDSVELSDPDDESDAAPIAPPPSSSPTSKSASADDFDVDDFLSNDPGVESKAKPKSSTTSKSKVADIDEDALLSDEPPVATKGKRKTSSKQSDDGGELDSAFQIRRNDSKSSAPKKAAPVDDDDEKSAPSRRPPVASSSATASNMASDLLAKSGKKGKKSAWSEMADEAKQESEYDFTDLKNQLLKKILPLTLGGIVLCVLLYRSVFSALGSKTYLPPLGQVTGKLTLNGKPVENATVWFHPVQPPAEKGDKKKRVSSSGGMTDAVGHYELKYLGDVTGVGIGECVVGIEAPSRSDIPAKYIGVNLSVKKTVNPGSQVIDIELSQ